MLTIKKSTHSHSLQASFHCLRAVENPSQDYQLFHHAAISFDSCIPMRCMYSSTARDVVVQKVKNLLGNLWFEKSCTDVDCSKNSKPKALDLLITNCISITMVLVFWRLRLNVLLIVIILIRRQLIMSEFWFYILSVLTDIITTKQLRWCRFWTCQ